MSFSWQLGEEKYFNVRYIFNEIFTREDYYHSITIRGSPDDVHY